MPPGLIYSLDYGNTIYCQMLFFFTLGFYLGAGHVQTCRLIIHFSFLLGLILFTAI